MVTIFRVPDHTSKLASNVRTIVFTSLPDGVTNGRIEPEFYGKEFTDKADSVK
jgi:hypothetical protein